MLTAIKIILMLVIVLLLSYPFISLPGGLSKLSVANRLKYKKPHNRKNLFFLILAIVELIIFAIIFRVFDTVAHWLYSIPFIGDLFTKAVNSINSQVDYIIFAIKIVIVNLLIVYLFIFAKAFLKKAILDPIYKLGKKPKKLFAKSDDEQKTPTESEPEGEEEEKKKKRHRRIPAFVHSIMKDEEEDEKKTEKAEGEEEQEKTEEPREYGRIESAILSLFFEDPDFVHARNWVVRTRTILQFFIRLTQVFYLLFLIVTLSAVFFPLPKGLYDFLLNFVGVGNWYIYPVISMIILQEICNIFETEASEEKTPKEERKQEEEEEDREREARIRALLSELKKRFDAEHSLRYYPEVTHQEVPKYKCTDVAYASALEYIGKKMEESSGRVVQSYMEFLDAIYKNAHVYFAASFYSELGEYLIAYTYIRLLAGSRMIFVVSDETEKETLRRFISDRLMRMTGSNAPASWRVYTPGERLDQADVLIASPEDFIKNPLTEQYPDFFEEACNAVFIDADRAISLNSYVCPIIATKLQNATDDRIRFIFLSLDLLKGFAAGSLPRFFCVDKVLSFSSAKENETVSYVLWNKESKRHRIYNKSGQKPTCLETIIADQACRFGIDGVRLITESPLEHAERQILSLHKVEINNLYKNLVDVNYMIYSDDRCNLSAALYACTRFRGRKKSVVHILSKPYMLREYFMSKAATEDYINRSSFIQPRVTEHAERFKLSLVRIFCDASYGRGISVSEFETRMRKAITATIERGDLVSSVFCKRLIASTRVADMKLHDLASYMIAGLCDRNVCNSKEEEEKCYKASVGHRAKDYYIVLEPSGYSDHSGVKRRHIIFNRVKDVFRCLLENNKRVELLLNDKTIGILDTFPNRVHMEYIAGQSIVYDNSEYEIEHIAEDGSAVYLRHENISIKNCLDTVLLRKYKVNQLQPLEPSAVLNNSKSILEEIRVTKCRADFEGTVYGFYGLTSDRQTLDFCRGVEGNPHSDTPYIKHHTDARALHLSLKTRRECNDSMRLLMAAVFNEFIKTIFPNAYHCIAICPILEQPLQLPGDEAEDTPLSRIKTLYPFLTADSAPEFTETDKETMQFLFINDCSEDVGVLDWFYDRSARYMQEFLANVYSYLHWLKIRPEKQHYVYFGGESLPECYDLEGLCDVLQDYNLLLSDDGVKDIETAGDDTRFDKIEYCSFCHKPMESGRYSLFDSHRFICADCMDTVDEQSRLDELYGAVCDYLEEQYPEIIFGAAKVKFDPVYDLTLEQILSEYYSRVDFANRTVYVETDDPTNTVSVSILRGLVALWQSDNALANQYSSAQLYYEEICYLRSIGQNESADWVYASVPEAIRLGIDAIAEYVDPSVKDEEKQEDPADELDEKDTALEEDPKKDEQDEQPAEEDQTEEEKEDKPQPQPQPKPFIGERRTSFSFMRLKATEINRNDNIEDPDDEEYSDDLYDPNKIPRFWKRYLRGDHLDDGKDDLDRTQEQDPPEEDSEDTEEPDRDEEPAEDYGEANAPYDDGELETLPTDENEDPAPTEEDPIPQKSEKELKEEEKQRRKEEKKRQKEERKRQKDEEWRKEIDKLKEKDEERKAKYASEKKKDRSKDESEKKKGFSWFGRKKKDEEKNEQDQPPVPEDQDMEEQDMMDQDMQDRDQQDQDQQDQDPIPEEDPPKKPEKKDKKSKKDKKEKKGRSSKKLTKGEKILPYEEEEAENPRIRLYNELVRAAYNYSEEPIPCGDLSYEERDRVYWYVKFDYPELFWMYTYSASSDHICHKFRCKDANGRLDVKQIEKKLGEMRKGAKRFTKGITKKTDPYEALLTIYRRVILTLDYDDAGLKAHIDQDQSRDDALRSLYNALVNHKVVCAGYAVAMQYLMQSVGIVCGYVISEKVADGTCHAFNILKIGKYCYYLDATWGDLSSTIHDRHKNDVGYDYFCVPYDEFIRTVPERAPYHHPRAQLFPTLEHFQYTNHEYYRFHNAYLKSYDERELIRIFAETAQRYDDKEMGDFSVSFRCASPELTTYVFETLLAKGKIHTIVDMARATAAKESRRAGKLLENKCTYISYDKHTGVVVAQFEQPAKDKKKKK